MRAAQLRFRLRQNQSAKLLGLGASLLALTILPAHGVNAQALMRPAAGWTAEPDPRLIAAQALLSEERIYRGKVNGFPNEEVEPALRRYQILHGLQVTGILDAATVERMHLQPSPKPAIFEQDRNFLRRAFPLPFVTAGVAASPSPAPTPTPVSRVDPTPARENPRAFLERYVEADSSSHPEAVIPFFADPVVYFQDGPLDKEALKKAVSKAHATRRSKRTELGHLEIISPPDAPQERAELTVRFSLRSELPGKRKRNRSFTEEQTVTLTPGPQGGWKISAIGKTLEKSP